MAAERSHLRTLEGVADAEVLERSLKNPAFFAVLVARYEKDFLRAANRVVKNREEAEDVVQDAFVKMYTKGHTYTKRPGTKFRSWAYTVLMNVAYSRYRKITRREVPVESFFDTLFFEEAELAAREHKRTQERRDMVERAMKELPDGLADLVYAHYFEGLSYKEISFEMGLPVSTLKSRLHRARALLRKHLLATR